MDLNKFFLVTFFLCTLSTLANPDVRLNLQAPAEKVTLTADGHTKTYTASASGIQIDGKSTGSFNLVVSSPDFVEINSRKFRKEVEIKQVSGKLSVFHTLPMESYIAGVISSEVPSSWPLETLKAQAIAARTYALWQKYQKEHLETSVMDQVYHGVQREHPLALQAVQETAGQVLTHDAKVAHTYFHASCGGHTASSKEAFGNNEPYLQGVKCPYCHKSPGYRWTYKLSRKELNHKLGATVRDIETMGESDSGRAKTVRLKTKSGSKDLKATNFRAQIGYNQIRSTLITKHSVGFSHAEFAGRGFGHGVGLCQWGALEMGKQGKTAEQILTFYYPGTEIRTFY